MNSQKPINVDLSQAEDIKCEECSGGVFVPAFTIKKLSHLISPSGQTTMVPIQTFMCAKCQHVNKEY